MTMSTCLIISHSLITLKPSMLAGKWDERTRSFVTLRLWKEGTHFCADKSFLYSYQAWRAQMGSTSVTYTIVPSAFRAAQQPLPTYEEKAKQWTELTECSFSQIDFCYTLTSPYPHTTTCFPPNMMSVVRFNLQDEFSTVRTLLYLWLYLLLQQQWFITRPVWTPCSSRGCQISAWSLSH